MTPLRLKTVLLSLVSIVVFFCGCSQKKPVLVVPKERPISGAPTPTPTPEPQQSSVPSKPEPTPEPTPSAADQAQSTPPKKKHHINKPSTATRSNDSAAQGNTKKTDSTTEAKAEPTPPGLIAPTISANDASRDRSSAEQLLQSTETNLNSLGKRQLSSDEQSAVSQIRNFVALSRQALKDNDPARAKNLALKANVLSNDLTKSR
jgi:outer membrane biosynthesis protein TonB